MRFLAILRPGRQVAPSAPDKVAYWQACRDYIAEKRADGSLEAYYWTNVLPAGLSSPKAMAAVGLLNVETIQAAHDLLQGYPGAAVEEGLAFELIPLLNGTAPYQTADRPGYRYLAMGKSTLYKARPVVDGATFEHACRTYLQEQRAAGVFEYVGWAHGPEQVSAYVFLNVLTHEALYAALRCYPATALAEGYQWQFHTLLDSEYCFNSLLEEAKAAANVRSETGER